jgi:hypothetical protein
MKNFIFALFALVFCAASVNAQSTSPRFGTTKSTDNTGRVLTFKLVSVTDAAGADSVTIAPNAWETIYKVAALDSITFKSPSVTNSYYGDQVTLQVTGTSGDLVKFTGTNWVSAGTATLSSGLNAIITFRFNGTKWVEQSRVVL